MDTVISQKDISSIVASIVANTKTTSQLVDGTLKTISTILKSYEKMSSSVGKINKLAEVIEKYNSLVADTVSALCQEQKYGKNLSELLGRIEEYDNDKKTKVTKFTIIDSAMQISKIIESSLGLFTKITDYKTNMVTMFKFRKNIRNIRTMLKSMLYEFVDIFSGISGNDIMDNILDTFIKQPDIYTKLDKSKKTGEHTSKSNIEEITKYGKLGLLDVIAQTFTIIDSVNNIKTPNFIVLHFKMLKVKRALKQILTSLIKFADGYFKDDTTRLKIAINGIKKIVKLLIGMIDILNSLSEYEAKFKKVLPIFDKIKSLFATIIQIGLLAIPVILSTLLLFIALPALKAVIWWIKVIFKNAEFIDVTSIETINNVIVELKDVFKNVIITGTLSLIALVPMIALTIASFALIAFVWAIKSVLKILDSFNLRKSITNTQKLSKLIFELGVVFAMVILILPVAAVALPGMLILTAAVLGFSFMVRLIISSIIKLAGRNVVKCMFNLLLISTLLVVISLMFLLISVIAKPVVKSSLQILGLLGVIVLITIALGTIGYLLGLLAPVFPVMIIGLGMLFIIIGIFALMALMLKFIQSIDLDKKLIAEKVHIIIDTCLTIITVIFDSQDKENEESKKGWIASVIEFVGGTLATIVKAIMAVAFLALMVVAILFISLIALELRLIQELDLDPGVILKNVGIVIDTALMVATIIFDTPDKDSKETKKGWIASVIEFIGGTLVTIVKAIMAVAFLALMVVAILLVTLIATELRLLQELNLDPTLISQNVGIVIDTALTVVSAIFDRPDKDTEESKKSWIVSVIEFIGGTLVTIVKAIMAIAFLALMVVAVLLVTLIARELKTLQELDLNPALISQNVGIVIDTAISVSNAVTNRKDKADDTSKKGWIRKLLEWVGMDGLVMIVDAIMALAWLGFTVAIINLVVVLARQLAELGKIELPKNITNKVNEVINCANQVADAVTNRNDPLQGKKSDSKARKFLNWFLPDSVKDIIDMVSRMRWVSSIMSIIGTVEQVANVLLTLKKIPNLDSIKNTANKVCNTADDIAIMVMSRTGVDIESASSRIKFLERINSVIKSLYNIKTTDLSKSKNALSGHIALIRKINEVDVVKLETSARMFEQMAKFSTSIRGDFQALASSINEDLMPVLEELKEIMELIPEKLDVGFQNTSASIAASGAAPTAENISAQISRENPNISKAELEKQIKARMDERAKEDAKGIMGKLDQMMQLLKGYSGSVVVKTI